MAKKNPLPPRMQKAVDQAELAGGMGLLLGLFSFLGIGGQKVADLAKQASEIAQQGQELANLPRNFNQRFQKLGWLMSESTNIDVAREAISLMDAGNLEAAEDLLCTQFEGDALDFTIMRLKSINGYVLRYELGSTAAKLCQAGQYAGAIPLIFIIVDGVATDAFGKSIFSEDIDVLEVKAIAGSAEYFPNLVADICRIRRRTNTEEIRFPYRNGIIHGKDINFANKYVAAKCWGLLSCLGDILRARDIADEIEDGRSLRQALKDYGEIQKDRNKVEAWCPRENIRITGDGAYVDQVFEEGTPEKALCMFLKYWKDNNFGKMGEATVYYDNRSLGKRAGEIRRDLEGFRFTNAIILNIKDEASAVTEVKVEVHYIIDGEHFEGDFTFRLIYFDLNMDILGRHRSDGKWQVMPFYQGWAIQRRSKS